MQIRDCKSLCLSTLYTGCIPPRYIVTMVRYWLCLSTLYTGCILKLSRNRAPRSCFASAHSIQVASDNPEKYQYNPVLCLSTLYTGCITFYVEYYALICALPQHTLYRLHRLWHPPTESVPSFASAHSIQVASMFDSYDTFAMVFASAHSIQVAS